MRLNLVARFKILRTVTELMDFRPNGAFVQNTPNQIWQKVNWKEQASFHIFCATSKTYIHSVCPNPWGFHNYKISSILIWKLEAADLFVHLLRLFHHRNYTVCLPDCVRLQEKAQHPAHGEHSFVLHFLPVSRSATYWRCGLNLRFSPSHVGIQHILASSAGYEV